MSSGGATTKGAPIKGASNPSNNTNNNRKSNKSDSKSDKIDLNPKIQPTAEQMQIARIIDTHRAEDPELQKKIRQVMEITRTTEDQACMALHSREYDIEQAITLLTEGGSQSLESEWAQAGKKRKPKNQKADNAVQKDQKGVVKDGPGGDRMGRDRSEKRDSRGEKKDLEGGDQSFVAGDPRRSGDRGGRGLGRGGGRGRGPGGVGRGGRSDKENDEMKGGRMINGPGRGRGGGGFPRGGRGNGRTFASRARGEREGESYHPIDVWENSQADGSARETPLKVEKWGEFPSAEDWDNEEYTGSLADTKVFTPSTQTAQGPLNDTTNGVGGSGPSNHIQSASNNSSADINKMSANQESGITMSSVVQGLAGSGSAGGSSVVPGQSIDLSMLLQKPQQNSATASSVPSHVNAGADLLATLQSSYSNSNQVPVGVSNQALPPRNKVQRPRGPTSKIPSSAVEMPDDSVTTLDVQFGGMDLSSDSSMSFSSVMQGGKSGGGDNLLYGGQGTKLDSFASAAAGDKDIKSGGHPSSPFQNQINNQSQGSLNEPGKGNVTSNISPGLDSLSALSQNQAKTQQTGPTSYGAAVNAGSNTGSAFASYGKGAPGFNAPGFPPVTQTPAGTYNNSSVAPVTGGPPPSSYGSQPLQSQTAQSGYHMGNMAYGNQPSNIPQSQPIIASANTVQSGNTPYGSGPPQNAYHLNSNINSGYANSSTGATQYGGYATKMSGSMNAVSSSVNSKDSSTDVNTSAPVSSTVTSAQLGSSMQPGSGEDWNYQTEQSFNTASSAASNAKIPTSTNSNSTTNATSKMGGGGMPPGMMMQPQYILGQGGTVPAFYSMQTPMYGYEDNSVQFVPRFPPNMAGYYDASGGAGYVTGAGVPGTGVTGRNDGAAMQGYSTGADARFQRSDSSTASPVPSNLAGGNTQQQAMYNPTAMPYYFVGNNMVHAGAHFPYGPPHAMYQAPMATAANTSGAPHAAAANHQYQSKGVYSATQYTYDASQGGPGSDFGKTSYTSGSGVGPNSNTGKVSSGSTPGVSQSTDLTSSMYAKGHNMGKMNSYDKGYVASGAGAYSALGGAQPNVLGSQLGGAGMGTPYGVYISQPVQTLPMHQDGGNASRQGPGQQKGNKQQQQQYGGQPYWGN